MILKPITTEKAVKMIEIDNTLLFTVERKSRKQEIAKEFEDTFKIKPVKIRTFIKGNKKYAFIKLPKNKPAIDIATKLGMI